MERKSNNSHRHTTHRPRRSDGHRRTRNNSGDSSHNRFGSRGSSSNNGNPSNHSGSKTTNGTHNAAGSSANPTPVNPPVNNDPSSMNTQQSNGSSKKNSIKDAIIIFLTAIAAAATIIGVLLSFVRNGTFRATVCGKELKSPANRISIVYIDKDSVDLSSINLFPEISNPSRFALEDVKLTYVIKASGASISYRNDYNIEEPSEGITEVTNKETTLFPKIYKSGPFRSFIMKENQKATIDLQATYSGVNEPFVYHSVIYTRKASMYWWDCEKNYDFIYDSYFASVGDSLDLYLIDGDDVYSSACSNLLSCPWIGTKHNMNDSNYVDSTWTMIERDTTGIVVEEISPLPSLIEQQRKPWYEFLLGGVFALLFLMGTYYLLLLIIRVKKEQKNYLFYIKLVVSTILVILSLFLSSGILFDLLEWWYLGFSSAVIVGSLALFGLVKTSVGILFDNCSDSKKAIITLWLWTFLLILLKAIIL